ncbi:MAG: hydroxymethylbilane synthase [Hellea sp.]|nr:hydroxymethylbilane synthase [Hellea sp.]
MQRPLNIGTRGSPLALYQARLVRAQLCDHYGLTNPERDVPIRVYKTSGDKLMGRLAEFGGKGLFTKELETALVEGEIDIAVHSMKDVPTELQDGHQIGAILEREDPRDAFISVKHNSIDDLPKGATVGTASLRRRAQLASLRPDLKFNLIRGNVGTRIVKLNDGHCDATMLAYAGLKRLDLPEKATEIVGLDRMLSAPSQAAIGIEVMGGNESALEIIAPLNHAATQIAVTAEREFLKALDGSCRTPIAALARIEQGKLFMQGEQLAEDGSKRWRKDGFMHSANLKNAARLGRTLGEAIAQEVAAS